MTDQDAIKDIAMWLEDMVLKRRLTHEEARDMAIKVRYWWKEADADGYARASIVPRGMAPMPY